MKTTLHNHYAMPQKSYLSLYPYYFFSPSPPDTNCPSFTISNPEPRLTNMYLVIPLLSLLTLAHALPHDESSSVSPVVTETIFLTVTHTLDKNIISTSPLETASLSVYSTATTMTSSCTHFSHSYPHLTGTQGVAISMSSYAASIRSEAVASREHDITTASSSSTDDQTTASMPIDDPVGWAGVDDALFTSISVPQNQHRDAALTTQARPWGRIFVGAMRVPRNFDAEDYEGRNEEHGECISCRKGRDIVCINATHFGYCDEGCVEPRRVKKGMKCVDGRMYGNGSR